MASMPRSPASQTTKIAYFSMEIGLHPAMPTYSGGLGILAGDIIRSAADLSIPMVAVTLIHRKGYFYQRLDASGWQREEPMEWAVDDFLEEMPERTSVTIEGRSIQIRAWKYEATGVDGYKVPVYFLDTDLPENSEWDRTLTHFLYGGDQRYRLCQEAILGIGGVRMLRAIDNQSIERFHMKDVFCCEGLLNMTYLALNLSHYINGVAKKHGEITRLMFAGYVIDAITNGVHAATWVATPFQELYDRYIPGWRQDNFSLRSALNITKQEVWKAHTESKKRLIQYVNRQTNVGMDMDFLTVGFARRATAYKRGDLLFRDIERLKSISLKAGNLQLIYSGKAHPHDQGGKELMRRIFQAKESLKKEIKIAYLENYDIELGKMMTSGVDLWLNTPQPPLEASGTSGMKAALNGVPSLSILDGWWIEGHIEGVTGWSIEENGRGTGQAHDLQKDAISLYNKLEQVIIPLYYNDRERFIDVMRHSIALNGSFFNTQRMLQQYVLKAYFL